MNKSKFDASQSVDVGKIQNATILLFPCHSPVVATVGEVFDVAQRVPLKIELCARDREDAMGTIAPKLVVRRWLMAVVVARMRRMAHLC
jgi:hypothetical protein